MALRRTAAALLCVAALCQSNQSYAARMAVAVAPTAEVGGFHGGGFHGGWHGGFAGVHNGSGNGHWGHWYHGWRGGSYGWWWGGGPAGTYYPYAYEWEYYPDYGSYGYSQPYASQYWYYCSDPAGYYPYMMQCNTSWQTVPAG